MANSYVKFQESELIRHIQKRFPNRSRRVVLGLRDEDDCALLSLTRHQGLLISTDVLVEDQHFKWAWTRPEELGEKALAVNVSDLAAKGGRPEVALLTLQIPRKLTSYRQVDRFLDGMASAANRYQCTLVGGDTVGSPHGTWSIGVTVLGRTKRDFVKRRSGARVGDIIAVTGSLGDSHAGWKWLETHGRSPQRMIPLLHAHLMPRAHLEEGLFLSCQKAVHAMMDLSDGLAADLPKLLKASGKGARLDEGSLPIGRVAHKLAHLLGEKPETFAWIGGEDYGLLVTIDANEFARIQRSFHRRFQTRLTAIGRVTRKGFSLPHGGKAQPFDHFTA